jgi:shikimate kinase
VKPKPPAIHLPPAIRNVILLGFRASGKTTVGRALADRLGWWFVDTDAQAQAATGQTIHYLFTEVGEEYFRRLETGIILGAARQSQQVVSVGGGAVLSAENRACLRAAGVCIWLAAPVEELQRRIEADPASATTRPALTAVGGLEEIRTLLRERGPLYAELAQHVVDTAGRTVSQVTDEILALLQPRRRSRKR